MDIPWGTFFLGWRGPGLHGWKLFIMFAPSTSADVARVSTEEGGHFSAAPVLRPGHFPPLASTLSRRSGFRRHVLEPGCGKNSSSATPLLYRFCCRVLPEDVWVFGRMYSVMFRKLVSLHSCQMHITLFILHFCIRCRRRRFNGRR